MVTPLTRPPTPPMPDVRAIVETMTPDLIDAAQQRGCWNRRQVRDALRSCREFIEAMEQELDKPKGP